MPRVAVIATVLNEVGAIGDLLRSLLAQSRPPDEIVIVDGGSRDGTLEALQTFAATAPLPLQVISAPGANISRGRNIAIAAATSEIIASADAGVRLVPCWLAELTAPFADDQPPDVVGGFFLPDPRTLFERALGAITLPRLEEIDPARFDPSSRSVAFRKASWQAVGGYPEWLDYCEDLVFDFGLRDAGYRVHFAPAALVHFRPRPTLRAFLKQYYRYARGDGKADLYLYRHLARYATYLVAFPALKALALWASPWWWLAVLAGLGLLLRAPGRRLLPALHGLAPREQLQALLWAPVIRIGGDLAKMAGYPVGVLWRLKHAPSEPWPRRRR
jgi:glycosyltransferase involved in cell wall biosynthesis